MLQPKKYLKYMYLITLLYFITNVHTFEVKERFVYVENFIKTALQYVQETNLNLLLLMLRVKL